MLYQILDKHYVESSRIGIVCKYKEETDEVYVMIVPKVTSIDLERYKDDIILSFDDIDVQGVEATFPINDRSENVYTMKLGTVLTGIKVTIRNPDNFDKWVYEEEYLIQGRFEDGYHNKECSRYTRDRGC